MLKILNSKLQAPFFLFNADVYRLPTEAEWEYVASFCTVTDRNKYRFSYIRRDYLVGIRLVRQFFSRKKWQEPGRSKRLNV